MQKKQGGTMYKICIDAGHGGVDSGASVQGLHEKDIVLNISKILKQILEKQNLQVYMTRQQDKFIELKDRAIIANNLKADIFVSIHCNSASSKDAHGFEIYHSKGSIQGQKLSSDIKLSINQNKELIRADRGIKTANFTVLTNTNMPAVLIELAFISNTQDRQLLQTKQQQYAEAIAKGILDYFNIPNNTKNDNIRLNNNTNILSKPTATKEQMKIWAKVKCDNKEFIDLVDIYYEQSTKIGINPVIAYAQMAHETGFLYKVKSAAGLDASYHNPCGLKISQGGGDLDKNAHMRFKNWQDGISAHLDHLALYAGARSYPKKDTLDPRHFSYLLSTAKTVEELSGKWAPNKEYGNKLKTYIKEIENIQGETKMTNTTDEKNIPSEWAKESWQKAKELKLIDGTRPKDTVTRQEVASIIVRLYEMLKQG